MSSFLYYIFELMGGEEQLALKLRTKDAKYGRHGLISRFFIKGDWQMGRPFMMNCKFGVLQYVLVKIIATIVVVVLQSLGKYHPEDWSWDSPAIYMVILINVRWVPSSSLNLSSWHSSHYFLRISALHRQCIVWSSCIMQPRMI